MKEIWRWTTTTKNEGLDDCNYDYKTFNTVIIIESYVYDSRDVQEKGMFKGMCHWCLRLKWFGEVYSGKELDIRTVL